ncbi:MarR family transcriptional regulator [Pusillimonas caeni]|uniref:MarR family winged helix-turn-helix transcriptional regulator n=1 Tax=Pusillimonas caeni TaxID=1348472 RepID=UPI000E59B045|nr:MarR family winged helix-turn-helix transcriptional regulator [Pusillimonas caeni]TFL14858.1 MarR family transcriptional regulator [Pusillimonas caeni]
MNTSPDTTSTSAIQGEQQRLRLVNALLPFLAVHTSIRDGYAAMVGISGPQYSVLLYIKHFSDKGAPCVKDVAEHLHLSASYITAEVGVLERKGLLVKTKDDSDQRVVRLALSERSKELLEGIQDVRSQVNNVQFGVLTPEELTVLAPIIERLIDSSREALTLQRYLATRNAKPHGSR